MDNYQALEPVDKVVIEAPAAYMGNITSITARKLLDLGGKRKNNLSIDLNYVCRWKTIG